MTRPSSVCRWLLLLLAVARVVHAETFPFVLPWDDASAGITNLSDWLEKPAGARGFVSARDGHLFAGEKRIRFFGVNVAFGGNFPTHADAEKIAARMAKFGINCVRFHHLDTAAAPTGILQQDKRTLDPEALDRLDYFVAQLKRNGIYANVNLHVGREYPGFAKWDGAPAYFKGVDNFFPPMIEQQREYARALLTHLNPYTGSPYAAEPAVAFIEINNENGLISEWNGGSLEAMPDPYAAEFRRQWNEWLARKYSDGAALEAAWKPGEEPLGGEMLGKAGAEGISPWILERHGSAGAAARVEQIDGQAAIHINVSATSPQAWHVQLNQPGLKFEQGRSYTVAFRARASAPHKIAVGLGMAHEPWKVLADGQAPLTTEWTQFRLTFSVSEGDDKARVNFTNLGSAVGDYFLADISVRPGGVLAMRDGETPGHVDVFRKNEIGARTPAAQRDWNRFLFDTEARYWPETARFIKTDLAARSLVLGSATGFSPWPVQAMLDVVDAHSYWQHPHFPHRPWDADDWTVQNVSMAGAPDGGALPSLALRRVGGKPFIVTEYNAAAPNTYSSEAFLELCALAGLQDWDGVFAFAYCHRKDNWDAGRITSFFDIDQHPTKMATLPAALALFCRADVQPPAQGHVAQTTLEDAIEMIRKAGSWHNASAYGVRPEEIFEHPVGVRIGDAQSLPEPAKPPASVIRSDNGQLAWDTSARRLLINTPRSVGVVGNLRNGETIPLGAVRMVPGATMQDWASITLTAMEGRDLKSARRVLLAAIGYAGNTDMGWKDAGKSSVGRNWGKAPSLVEGIPAAITLPFSGKARMWALDERGQRKSEIAVQARAGEISVEIGPEHRTLWYEIASEP